MSYNIIKTDGTPLATVADGQTNSSASSLTLIGKNYAGYGTFLNENFIRLLENFASSSAPLNPIVGQLWWRTDTRLLQVYDKFGNWKTISGAQSTSDAPSNAIAGDLWFDTVNQQLKTYSGASWIVIGPSFTATTGTSGAIADTIIDSGLVSHVVVKFFVQNNLVAILSKDTAFTPSPAIPGFLTVKPGFNLATDRIPALVYYENANNTSYLGGILAANYLTKTTPVVDAQIEIQNTDGIKITETGGTIDYAEISVNDNNLTLSSVYRGNGFIIATKPENAGGTSVNVLTVDRNTGLITVNADPTGVLGIATKGYVDTADNAIKGFIASNTNTINSSITALTANTNSVYGNVRVLQSDLGIYTAGSLLGNSTQWNQIMNSGQNFAANVVALWANVAAIHANVLSNPGVAPAATASMFSNVRSIQNTLGTLSTGSLLRDGTSSILGVLAPDQNNIRDLANEGNRFRDFYANTANVHSIVHGATSGTTPGIGDIGQPDMRFGTVYVTAANVHSVVKGGTSGTGDIGSTAQMFGNAYVKGIHSGLSTSIVTGTWQLASGATFRATYADLAERFAADAAYPEGTVVTIGGTHEVTQENTNASETVFGVVSHNFAYLMNEGAGDNDTHPPIALTGRVNVRVVGQVTKGQRLVSAGNGCARAAADGEATAFNVLGRALENKETAKEALVMSVVQVR
jgi:hypothetical protein